MPTPRRFPALLIAAAAALLMVAAARVAGDFAERRAIDQIASRAQQSAVLVDSTLANEVGRYRAVPMALAGDSDIRRVLAGSADAMPVNDRLAMLASALGAAAIYAVRADGLTVAASNARRPESFIGQRYRFRRYFTDALATGAAAQFALGSTTMRPGLYLSNRVDGQDGPLGVVVVKLELLGVEADWVRSGLTVLVTDAAGSVIVTSVAPWRFAPLSGLPITGDARSSVVRFPTREQAPAPHVVAQRPSAVPGWTIHLFEPHAPEVAAAGRAARAGALLAVGLAAMLAGLGWRRIRRTREEAERTIAVQRMLEARVAERTTALRAVNRQLKSAIASREQAEQRASELNLELEQANRLAMLGHIAAGVTHEIGQPVAAIRATAHTGRTHLARGEPDEAAAALDRIGRMTERIGAINTTLRDFARRGAGPRRPVRMRDAIAEAQLLMEARIRQVGARVIAPPPPPELRVEAERVRVEQILANLLQNALDAVEGRPAPEIRIDTRREGEDVVVDVSDSGPGVPAAAAAQLFMPFRTAKERGTGLGLVISRDIATTLGGSLIHLPDGAPPLAGAAFRLRLPLATRGGA